MADPKITIRVEGSGLPGGGADGQVLSRQDGKPVWVDVPSELPEGGDPGDVLTLQEDGAAWIPPAKAPENVSELANDAGYLTASDAAPHQQLVTDADGNAKWEDKPSGGVIIDATLSMAGAAADAAAVGGKINAIKEVAIVSKASTNLFNPDTLTVGGIQSDGSFLTTDTYTNYRTSDFIAVDANTDYAFTILIPYNGSYRTSGGRKMALLFDADKNPVSDSYINQKDIASITFNSGSAAYVRVGGYMGESGNYTGQLEVGTSYTTYQEYGATDVLRNDSPGILYDKVWVACGDSFTAGGYTADDGFDESVYKYQSGRYAGANIVYPYIIGLRNGMTIVNEAIGGTTMCGTVENAFSIDRYKAIPSNADYITLYFGINDNHQGVSIGTIDDADNTTFIGAWNVVLEYLIEHHPAAHIGIIVTNGASEEITAATIAVAKKWGIPYLDFNSEQVPLMLRVTGRSDVCDRARDLRAAAFRISETNTHPNVAAHRYESTFIENWLRTL